jgi:hypothetical protein
MSTLQLIVTGAALLATSALLRASLYDAAVLAPNLHGGPTGLEHGRLFMRAATPANLFRILSPATQVLVLIAMGANGRARNAGGRSWLRGAAREWAAANLLRVALVLAGWLATVMVLMRFGLSHQSA